MKNQKMNALILCVIQLFCLSFLACNDRPVQIKPPVADPSTLVINVDSLEKTAKEVWVTDTDTATVMVDSILVFKNQLGEILHDSFEINQGGLRLSSWETSINVLLYLSTGDSLEVWIGDIGDVPSVNHSDFAGVVNGIQDNAKQRISSIFYVTGVKGSWKIASVDFSKPMLKHLRMEYVKNKSTHQRVAKRLVAPAYDFLTKTPNGFVKEKMPELEIWRNYNLPN